MQLAVEDWSKVGGLTSKDIFIVSYKNRQDEYINIDVPNTYITNGSLTTIYIPLPEETTSDDYVLVKI